MKIAFVAPSPIPFVVGGAEKLLLGLMEHVNAHTAHQAELIKLPVREADFWGILDSYRAFSCLDLAHFDRVVVSKYPAWMVAHRHKVCYLLHRKRPLYDWYPFAGGPPPRKRHPSLAKLLRTMERNPGRREALPELFSLLDGIKARSDVPPETFAFPGPWIRAFIHYLDGVGLSPKEVRHYAAISGTVARRDDYFPGGVPIQVLHPPSRLRARKSGAGRYFFTASRFEKAKRIDLLIQAMRRSSVEVPLKIAGTGPLEAALREAAGEDPRIEFLGFRPDAEIARLYAGALAVPFVPKDEDYGLVAVEAMSFGKPVITASDSGGPTELVRHGENGWIVAPRPGALARRLESVYRDPEGARRMGEMARRAVASIGWERTLETLLRDAPPAHAGRTRRTPRPKITAAVSFPIWPPRSGAQARLFHLYRNLAREADVELVSMGWPATAPLDELLAPGLREIRSPISAAHAEAEAEISRALKVSGIPIRNVSMPRLYKRTPAYLEALRRSAAGSEFVIASFPFLLPAIQEVTDKPLVYEAHNVEWDIRRAILPDIPAAQPLLAATREVEGGCVRLSRLVAGCSETDWRRIEELYGAFPAKFLHVPNGVDLRSVPFIPASGKARAKRRLGLADRFSAVFMGAWYGPNIEAARRIIALAAEMPDIDFWLLGGVCLALEGEPRPDNVRSFGIVDDFLKAQLLGAADAALNPMEAGSGTHLKMLDYCAAGAPVLTTPLGIRGLSLSADEHVLVSEWKSFQGALAGLRRQKASQRAAMAVRARGRIEELYDWEGIARMYLDGLRRCGLLPGAAGVDRRERD